MNYRKLLIPAVAALAFTASAQSLDPASRAVLRRHALSERVAADSSVPLSQAAKMLSPIAAPRRLGSEVGFPALIKLSDGSSIDMIEGEGIEIFGSRHGFVFATVTADAARRLDINPAVRTMELSRRRDVKMDLVRRATGVDRIHQGIELPQAYTGKGVVCGVVDAGFDPNHPNFLNADGSSRFGYFTKVVLNQNNGNITISQLDPTKLSKFTTDDLSTFHGTHTTGIMAGSYRGNALTAQIMSYPQAENVEQECPYYGIAYDAELAASTGTSYDALIAYALDGILQWRAAERSDCPVVVNMSVGGNQGPHDGSSLICQFIDQCAEEDNAVICVAAGNEGDIPLAVTKKFTADDHTLKTGIQPFVYGPDNGNIRYGLIEIYSDDATPFEMQAVIYNKSRGSVICRMPMSNTPGSSIQYWCSSSDFMGSSDDIVDTNFARAFEGYVGVVPVLDPDSGRFYAAIDLYTKDNDVTNASGNYVLAIEITGAEGHSVYGYTDGMYINFSSFDIAGWTDGTTDGTISDVACGFNTISVGAFNTRSRAATLTGMAYENPVFTPGEFTLYTSYGNLPDGRSLPHLCAPGAMVVSSASTPFLLENAKSFVEENPLLDTQTVIDAYSQAKVELTDRTSYYVEMNGTSMATPVVSGTAALMLEANPNLSFNEVRDILIETAVKDDSYFALTDPAQGGAGKIDSYAAVKRAIEMTGVVGIEAEREILPFVTQSGNRQINVALPGATHMSVSVFDIAGRCITSVSASSTSEIALDGSAFAPGVYILKVNSAKALRFLVK